MRGLIGCVDQCVFASLAIGLVVNLQELPSPPPVERGSPLVLRTQQPSVGLKLPLLYLLSINKAISLPPSFTLLSGSFVIENDIVRQVNTLLRLSFQLVLC